MSKFTPTKQDGWCSFCDTGGPTIRCDRDKRVTREVLFIEMCEFCYRMGCGPTPGTYPERENLSRLARVVVEMLGES